MVPAAMTRFASSATAKEPSLSGCSRLLVPTESTGRTKVFVAPVVPQPAMATQSVTRRQKSLTFWF